MFNGTCPYGSFNAPGILSNWSWIGAVFQIIFGIALLAGLLLLLIWLARQVFPSRSQSSSSARGILQMRYARGEINHEQYQQMQADLKGGDS